MSNRARTCAIAAACGLTGLHTASIGGQQSRPDQSPSAAISHCVKALSDEARRSKADGALVRTSRTFAKEADTTLPIEVLLERVLRRVDSDDFTDAYVRWQLTGFDVGEFTITDRAFDRLMETLPGFLENPRADAALIDRLNKAAGAGQLSERQQTEVNAKLNDLASRSSAIEALNVPATEFRAWLLERLRGQPLRGLTIMLERAESRAKAGWPIDDAKADIDKALEKAAQVREFTADHRRDFLRAAEKCITSGRLTIVSAAVAGEALSVQYATTGIFDFDVRRWEKALREP